MARASSSGQAVIELIYATLFFITAFTVIVSLLGAADQALHARRFRTQEATKWIDSRK